MVSKLTRHEALIPFTTRPFDSLHLSEIARELKQPHPTVRLWLNHLEQKGVLKKEYKGGLTIYGLNHSHANIVDHLAIAEKLKLTTNCEKYPTLAELCRNPNDIMIIFGSSAINFKTAKDIDLLTTKPFSFRKAHVITVKYLENTSEALRKEIVKKHLILSGSEIVIRWMLK